MAQRKVSDTRVIAAPASAIFDLLVDPAKHPLIDGSGTVLAALGAPGRRLALGDRFGMDMKIGLPYKIRNTVVEFEQDRLIAWRHFYGHRWRWELRDLGDGRTEVTETFDWSKAWSGVVLELVKAPAMNLNSIRATLDRLEARFAPA